MDIQPNEKQKLHQLITYAFQLRLCAALFIYRTSFCMGIRSVRDICNPPARHFCESY